MKLKISIILAILSVSIFAQQNNTMFYMHRLPQASLLNPAIQPECKLTFSGIIIPVSGQLFPATHTSIGSTGFAYQDMIQYNSVLDSLMMPTSKGFDYKQLLDKLKKVNFVTLEEHIDILSIGYKWKNDWRFTFNIATKIEARANFSKDIVQFMSDGGNGDSFSGETAQMGKFGITATHWNEIGIGASKKINSKFTVGARAKILFGTVNIWSKKTDFTWNTNATDYSYNFNADMEVRTSQPFYQIDKFYYDYDADSMVFEGTELSPKPKNIALTLENPGAGLDLGVDYIFNDKINIYASLIDFGFIRWNSNVNTFVVKGDYTFDGYDPQPYATENDSIIDEHNTEMKQEIINIFMPEQQVDHYYSFLTPKITVGGTYKFHEKISAGLLYRAEIYQNRIHSSVTISANSNLTKWFSGYLSYSVINNSYTNLGIGLVAKGSIFQFFAVTDNVFGYFWPNNTRIVNGRLGINLVFGCKKQNTQTLIGKSQL